MGNCFSQTNIDQLKQGVRKFDEKLHEQERKDSLHVMDLFSEIGESQRVELFDQVLEYFENPRA